MGTILDLVGNTPLTEITNVINKPGIKVFGKLEGQNPGGSVKDRAAYGMIKGALDRGELKPGMRKKRLSTLANMLILWYNRAVTLC